MSNKPYPFVTDAAFRVMYLVCPTRHVLPYAHALVKHTSPLPSKAGVGFPLDRLSASATRQLALGGFPLPSAQEIADVLYEKLLVQVSC